MEEHSAGVFPVDPPHVWTYMDPRALIMPRPFPSCFLMRHVVLLSKVGGFFLRRWQRSLVDVHNELSYCVFVDCVRVCYELLKPVPSEELLRSEDGLQWFAVSGLVCRENQLPYGLL